MATEEVKFLITAENRAEGKFRMAQKQIKDAVGGVRTMGESAKRSTELVGTMAQQMGGSWLGSFSGQVAMATERMSAFSSVATTGAGGLMLFKAGAVGIASVLTYQVTKAIYMAVSGFSELKTEIENTEKAMDSATDRMLQMKQQRFGMLNADELKGQSDKISQEIERLQAKTEGYREELDRLNKGFHAMSVQDFVDWAAGSEESTQALLDNADKQLRFYQDLADQIKLNTEAEKRAAAERKRIYAEQDRARDEQLETRARKYVQDLKKEIAYLQATEEEKLAIRQKEERQAVHTASTQDDLERLIKERDAVKQRLEAEKEAAALRKQQAQEESKIADMTKRTVEQLQLEAIRIKEGEEAARAMALTMQGIDKDTADRIASLEAMIQAVKNGTQDGNNQQSNAGPNNALESRFLSGRTVTTDYTKVTAEQTKKTTELNAQQLKMLEEAQAELRRIAENTENQIREAQ